MKRLLALLLLLAGPAEAQYIQNLNTVSVTVGTTATLVVPARTRNAVTVTVLTGGSTVFCGSTSAVTASGTGVGFPIAASTALTLQPYNGPVWCIIGSSTQAVKAIESF